VSSINNNLLLSTTIHDTWHQPPSPTATATIDCLQPWHTTNNKTTNSEVATPCHEPQRPPAQPQMMKNTQK